MAAVFLDIQISGIGVSDAVLGAIGAEGFLDEARVMVGGLVESQTRLRFQTKMDPDGEAWAPWSEAYAKSRHRGHSLLMGEGHLLDSIHFDVEDDQIRTGSNLVYAAIHQHGGEEGMAPGPAHIPARAYLGFSDANLAEIEHELTAWVERRLQ